MPLTLTYFSVSVPLPLVVNLGLPPLNSLILLELLVENRVNHDRQAGVEQIIALVDDLVVEADRRKMIIRHAPPNCVVINIKITKTEGARAAYSYKNCRGPTSNSAGSTPSRAKTTASLGSGTHQLNNQKPSPPTAPQRP